MREARKVAKGCKVTVARKVEEDEWLTAANG